MDPLTAPVSIVLALWAPVPSSHGLSLIQGPDGVHDVIGSTTSSSAGGSPGSSGAEGFEHIGLERWLTGAREEGVVVEGAPGKVLLVPEGSGTSVTWRAEPVAGPLPPMDAGHARRQVHAATEEAIEALIELDLARERPEMADTLNDLLTAVMDPRLIPPWLSARNRELLERSLRLAGVCELALDDDGAATTALQVRRRSDVLRPLLAVARHGAAAATEWWAGSRP